MKMRVVPEEATDEMGDAYWGSTGIPVDEFERGVAARDWLAMLSAAPSEGDDVVKEMAEALDEMQRVRWFTSNTGSAIVPEITSNRLDAALARYRAVFGGPDHG